MSCVGPDPDPAVPRAASRMLGLLDRNLASEHAVGCLIEAYRESDAECARRSLRTQAGLYGVPAHVLAVIVAGAVCAGRRRGTRVDDGVASMLTELIGPPTEWGGSR